ncbi:transcriptional regulator, DeoR family [Coriobacterium glomerans PW2]|uniref:Transcriptional regulator, DeoR family n=1 Tax=Coriobacterium glomerans (strain ATCC 49209 / DSM 20642 / JCM 10262 / PW2) TaxID=700015 RepID=F2N8Y9_CORGP|nr:DeoR/GlpR family DNA-binding transcription regulator [Coriobacterium glomerans]AEB07589.1 transcriptional regulator, DeoR family [Coriobacterium glomerans PW2]
MAAGERLETIRALLTNDGQVSVSDLSRSMSVTEETIRRDLEKLEAEGFLMRTYGGAVLNEAHRAEDVHFYRRTRRNLAEKRAIALNVLPILQGKHAIAADASSTVLETIRLIGNREDVSLLTYSAAVFHELNDPAITIVSPGGQFDKSGLALYGRTTIRAISQYHVDILLLSCKSLSIDGGLRDSRESEAETKRVLIERAKEIALLADHSKFDQNAFVPLADLDRIDYLVTDCEPSDDWKQACCARGVKLLY